MRRPVATTKPPTTTGVTAPQTSAVPIIVDWRTDSAKRLQIRTLCVRLMGTGVTKDRIPDALRTRVPDITDQEAFSLYWSIMKEWRDDYSRESSFHRSAQIQRLMSDLSKMRTQAKPPWQSIGRHEELVSKITGTIAPVRVTVMDAPTEIREALTTVIAELSDQEVEEFLLAEGVSLDE